MIPKSLIESQDSGAAWRIHTLSEYHRHIAGLMFAVQKVTNIAEAASSAALRKQASNTHFCWPEHLTNGKYFLTSKAN